MDERSTFQRKCWKRSGNSFIFWINNFFANKLVVSTCNMNKKLYIHKILLEKSIPSIYDFHTKAEKFALGKQFSTFEPLKANFQKGKTREKNSLSCFHVIHRNYSGWILNIKRFIAELFYYLINLLCAVKISELIRSLL